MSALTREDQYRLAAVQMAATKEWPGRDSLPPVAANMRHIFGKEYAPGGEKEDAPLIAETLDEAGINSMYELWCWYFRVAPRPDGVVIDPPV